MAEIKLANGQVALVDEADLPKVSRWKWHVDGGGYARRNTKGPDRRSRSIYMHRVIMDEPPGLDIDHINGNRLDNRRDNLLAVPHVQSLWNRRAPAKGITRAKNGAWRAFLDHRGQKLELGHFRDEATALAARRYAEAVLGGREPPPFDPLWLAPKARRFVRGCFALTRDVVKR